MSRGATVRLFVAVDPPPEVCGALAAWARAAAAGLTPDAGAARGGVRLLDAELLHLTLCFLGSRPVAEVEPLAAALEGCAEHACELSLGAPLWLPARAPRALAVSVHDQDGELVRLREELAGALAAVSGWEDERRRLRPHITVARMRGGRRRSGRTPPQLPPTPRLGFVPERLCLYRSWLDPAGARYETVASCTLLPAGR